MKRLTIALSFCAALASSAEARPLACRQGSGATGYTAGFNQEQAFLEQLWATYGSCEQLNQFVSNLDVALDTSTSPSQFIRCRNHGINSALAASVEEISVGCASTCVQAGANLGTLSAKLFCGIGANQQSQIVHVPLCDDVARDACAQALTSTTTQLCAPLAVAHPDRLASFVEYTCGSDL